MKKALLILVAAVAVLSSCSSNDHQTPATAPLIHVTKHFDTVVYTTKITTANRYSCSGHKLPQPKLTSIKTVAIPIHVGMDTTVGGSAYNKGGYDPIPTTVTPSQEGTGVTGGSDVHYTKGGIPEWLEGLLWILLALVAVALAVAFMWWLYQVAKSKDGNAADTTHGMIKYGDVSEAGPVVHRTDAGNERHATNAHPNPIPAPQENKEEVKEDPASNSVSDLEILKQIQKTGGKYNRSPDGSLSIEIPEQFDMPLVVIIEAEKPKKEKRN